MQKEELEYSQEIYQQLVGNQIQLLEDTNGGFVSKFVFF